MKKLQRVNSYFKISENEYKKTGAFNPVIGIDSLFFVDPLLLSKTKVPEFKEGLKEIRSYFSKIIILLKTNNTSARKLTIKKLNLKEVRGIGIGYGNETDDGSAIGPKLASKLVMTAENLLKMGISDPAIFEVMGLFEEDFGPDRLSDALLRILLKRVYSYSERVTKELSISETFIIKTYERDYVVARHPHKTKPLLFIPEEILRELPIANSFEEISVVAAFNEELRIKFNQIIKDCFGNKDKPKKKELKKYFFGKQKKELKH